MLLDAKAHLRSQALPRELVDNVEDSNLSSVFQLVLHYVIAPDVVHILWRSFIAGIEPIAIMMSLFATLLGYTQVALTPDAVHSLVIDDPAQYTQNLGNPPIPIAAMFVLIGLFADSIGKELILRRHLRFITLCIAVLSKGFACLAFADSQLLSDCFDGLSARSWVYEFFEATSRRMAFSMA